MSKTIITISRQYGSNGREIGKRVAELLHIPFYDKELIELASKESGIQQEHFEEADEKVTGSLLYSLSMGMNPFSNRTQGFTDISLSDRMFLVQSDIIRKVAQEGSCVIVGRCADYILRNKQPCLNVFIHANIEQKIATVSKRREVDEETARNMIIKINKKRRNYYSFYADDNWGKIEAYHLSLDSGVLGADLCADIIVKAVRERP